MRSVLICQKSIKDKFEKNELNLYTRVLIVVVSVLYQLYDLYHFFYLFTKHYLEEMTFSLF